MAVSRSSWERCIVNGSVNNGHSSVMHTITTGCRQPRTLRHSCTCFGSMRTRRCHTVPVEQRITRCHCPEGQGRNAPAGEG